MSSEHKDISQNKRRKIKYLIQKHIHVQSVTCYNKLQRNYKSRHWMIIIILRKLHHVVTIY